MARDHARLRLAIWSDPDFRRLTEVQQRAYFMALSQPGLTYCGVVPYTLRRWEQLAADSTVPKLRKAVSALEAARFVLVDDDTEELLIRSFVKHDGILASGNVARAMVKAYPTIHSARLRQAFLVELHRLNIGPQEEGWEKGWAHAAVLLGEALPEGLPEDLAKALRDSRVRAVPGPSPDPVLDTECGHGFDKPSACALCRVANRVGA